MLKEPKQPEGACFEAFDEWLSSNGNKIAPVDFEESGKTYAIAPSTAFAAGWDAALKHADRPAPDGAAR